MPAVAIPVIAGMAAGAGAYAATTIVLSTAISIGMAVASATMMLMTKTPSLGDYTSASERSQLLRAAASAKVACYGRVVSSALMSFAEEEIGEQTEGEWLHLAVVLTGHEIDRLGKILVGEDEVSTYGDLVSYTFHNNPTEADSFLLANCPSWKPDMIGRGLAWLRISYKSNFEKFPAGLPNLRIEKFGRRVYDPRDGQTKWTDNAALVILDYYRHWLKTPDDEINFEEFKVAANICDEIVTRPDGRTEPRYTLNGEFDLTEPKAKVLEAMHAACAGQPTYVGGRHGIVAGAYYGPATDELHDYQIIGDIELLPEPSSADRINTVTGTFVDPDSFTVTDFPSVVVKEWVEEDGGIELAEDLDLRFVTSPYQAQRLANIMLRQRRTSRTLTVPVNLSGWRYRPGSYLRLYIPALGIAGAEFRVVDWGFNLLGGVNLTLREESAAVWDDAVGKSMERPDITTLPTGGLAMPDDLRYETEQIGDVVQGVLHWRNAGRVVYNQVIIQRLSPPAKTVTVHTAQVTGELCRLAGLPAGNYVALVRAVSITGAHSAVAAVNFTIEVPATPTGVEVEAGNWSLAIRPLFTGGTDNGALCEWWWSRIEHPINEAMTKATFAGTASYMTLQGLRPDTQYYVWLRAVNAYGKSGLLAATAKTLYDPESILDVLDGELGLDQLKEELRRPIEKIPALDKALFDVSAIVADIKPVAERVPTIEHMLTEMDGELASVAQRAEQAESVLKAEQDTLGSMGINTALQQDKLHGMLSSVRKEISDVRDAIFTVDPETGNIEMDAVRALRDEVHASVTHINQTLDALEGTLSSKASQAVQDAQGQRLTEAEQLLDGIKGQLTQLVTKSEFTAQGERLTEVSQKLDAATGELSQKAAQSDVTAQGERLGVAEQRLSATADQASATAKAVDGLTAKVTEQGKELTAAIINVAEVSASATEQVARRVSGLETRTDSAEGKIRALEEVVESEGGVTAGRFDEISARLDLNKVAADDAAMGAIGAALAGDAEAQRQRQTSAAIQRDQRVQVEAHQALAKTVETLSAEFEGEQADTAARFTSLREVVAGVEQSTTQQLEQQRSEYQQGDQAAQAALEEQGRTLAAADKAQVEQITQLSAKVEQGDSLLAADIKAAQKAQVEGDQALTERLDQQQTEVGDTKSQITALAKTVSDGQQSTAQALEVLDSKTEHTAAQLGNLSETVAEQGKALATSQSDMMSEVDLAAIGAIGAALAGDEADQRARKARTEIKVQQQTQADEQKVMAKTLETLGAEFQGEKADTAARFTTLKEVVAGVEQSTTQQLEQQRSEYQAADRAAKAALEEQGRTLAAADQALAEKSEKLQADLTLQGKELSAAVQSVASAQNEADKALGQRIDTVQASVTEQGKELSAAVQSVSTAQKEGDKALGQRLDTVQASVTEQGKELSAAVQTVAKAQADTAGKLSAGWYTKVQINGEGGGFGLSVTMASDGSIMTSFAIDADVFAVLSRAGGVTSKRNPFVIKNGITYINHAMMDTAEIANVIAKYIRVTSLDAATIVNSDFKGGNAGFGRGGPYGGWGEGWHTIIYADGTIRTNKLYADSGSFTGHVRANSGEFNNVVIRENCQILGQLDVTQVVGDIVKMIQAPSNFYVPAYRRARVLVAIKPINVSAAVSGQGEIGIRLICKLNGQEVGSAQKTQYVPTGGNPYFNVSIQPAIELPAYSEGNVTFEVQKVGGNGISNIQFSGTATWLIAVK
ncbi:phage tail tip protein J-related protein [Aeromonas salmonicida]|uniref:phage tail tip protein J-related protein n=1 Tax=Aeromonas salmonicida TaxID=645 RepID=UPI003D1F5690